MSIFQTKAWWSTKVGANEEFDHNHLCLAELNPSEPNQSYIIIGSFSGFLRIYDPKRRNYKIEDLIYETDLKNPIIQIITGRFTTI